MRMKTPEKIKKGLLCGSGVFVPCKECAYRNVRECNNVADADALAYIDKLEAKLAEYDKPLVPMTFEETYKADYCYIEYNTLETMKPYIVVVGSMAANSRNERIVGIYEFGETLENCLKLRGEDYGKIWRCWPQKPTDEERKAAKWDG